MWLGLPVAGLVTAVALVVFLWRARGGISLLRRFAAVLGLVGAGTGLVFYFAGYANLHGTLMWNDMLAAALLCYTILLAVIAALAWSIAEVWAWRVRRA